jgi:ADP-heptose:LPS heptosyltransferase
MKGPILRIVLASTGIGDAVLLTPALRAWRLQNPTGMLHVYCGRRQIYDVLLGNPNIDCLHMLRFWHRARYSRAHPRAQIRVPSILHSLIGGPKKEPAAKEIAASIGIEIEDLKLDVFVSDKSDLLARRKLSSYSLPVCIHTTPAAGANKQWTFEGWKTLVRSNPHFSFIQIGAANEKRVPGTADLLGTSISDAIALIAQSRAYVGVDSGFAHIASALNVPSVVLFGATDPYTWGHSNVRSLYAGTQCSPCLGTLAEAECPYRNACMIRITPHEVSEALSDLLTAPTLQCTTSYSAF